MKKPSLVILEASVLFLVLLMSGSWAVAVGQIPGVNAVGEVIPLPGHTNELFVDEARRLLYAGNFSAGRVEVVSMDTLQRISSIATTPQPAGTSGMAVSPDRRWLVTTNVPVTSGVTQLSGVTVVNLNDPNDRRHFAMLDEPLAVAFGANNEALIIAKSGLQLFDPVTGGFRVLLDLTTCPECGLLPTSVSSKLPRQIITASASSSLDGIWLFGQTDSFVFSYLVRTPVGQLTVRPIKGVSPDVVSGGGSLVRAPAFEQVSGSPNGTSFLAGQLLFTRDLRVMADAPQVPNTANPDLLGGHAFDPDSSVNTVYFSFVLPEGEPGGGPAHPINGILHVMDADNLRVRQQLRTADRINGRIVVTSDGNDLFAVSESGLLHISLANLGDMPLLEVNPADRQLVFEFDNCLRDGISKTIRLENPLGGEPAQFSLSTILQRSGDRPAVLFEPHQGTTPAEVRVTVDAGALGPVQGIQTFPILISTDAVNIPRPATVVANVKDVDQRGRFIPVPGQLVEVVGDPFRDRLYVLDQQNFEVLMFDSNDFRLLGSFRTGNTPTQMAVSTDGTRLVVANSQSENLTLIDLLNMRVIGPLYLPWQTLGEGHYPFSVASDNTNRMLIGVKGSSGAKADVLNVTNRSVSSPDAFGVFANNFSSIPAVAASPDGSSILLAESGGLTQLWESGSQRIILARQDFGNLSGGIGAGPNFFVVENHVLNTSLVPKGQFPDANASQISAGFAVMANGTGVRSVRPTGQVDTGALHQIDQRDPTIIKAPVRMAAPPPPPTLAEFPFTRSLAGLRDGKLVSTSSAGIIEFPPDYAASIALPRIAAITNAADFTTNMGAGGLISIFGDNLAPESAGATDTPLPNLLADVCVTANGASLPLLFVSPNQINAQLQFSSVGPVGTVVRTPGGISDTFISQVDLAAPAMFSVAGPDNSQFAAVFRAKNNQLSTLSNPLRQNEIAIIYATGLGPVTPLAVAGVSATASPLAVTIAPPVVEFGGVGGDVLFAGLAPGFVGLYQINVRVPGGAPLGLQVPMTITGGAITTSASVRIVD